MKKPNILSGSLDFIVILKEWKKKVILDHKLQQIEKT